MVVFHRDTEGVEKYENDDEPVEPLLLHRAPDEKSAKFKFGRQNRQPSHQLTHLTRFSQRQNCVHPPDSLSLDRNAVAWLRPKKYVKL